MLRVHALILFLFSFLAVEVRCDEALVIKGIVIVSDQDCLLSGPELDSVEGVRIDGVPYEAQLQSELLPFCFCAPVSDETMTAIRKQIENCFSSHGHPFVAISTPDQEISSGVVQFVVQESRLEEIKVSGTSWTSPALMKKTLRLKENQPIDQFMVFRALNVINRNPFHSVTAVYEPGNESMTTSLDLVVQDRRPFACYFGADDTGIKYIGEPRLFAGASWGNAFWLNHILTFQYTASVDFHEFQAFTVQYIAPLFNGNLLNIYGGYSSVYPEITDISSSHGYSVQASARYLVPFAVRERNSQELVFGADFKRTNNVVQFVPIGWDPIAQGVNLTQAMLGYNWYFQEKGQMAQVRLEGFGSPGSFLPDQSNADYNELRAGAKHRWFYLRALTKWEKKWSSGWSTFASASGQYATNNLLPSEQFGLGGWDSVRGYRERQLDKESAVAGTVELRTPSLSLKNGYDDLVYGLIFLDGGWGMNRTALGTWDRYDAIAGAGPGIRINIKEYLRIRADWGWRLVPISDPPVGYGGFLHFSAVSTF